MRYELVVSDFDGTLLRRDDTISERTVRAIRAYTEAGGTFAVSTGRSYASIVQRLGELGITGDVPVMCCQGAIMRTAISGKILSVLPMTNAAAVAFLRRAADMGGAVQFYTPDEVIVPYLNENNAEYFRANRITPRIEKDLFAAAENCTAPILKVLAVVRPDVRETMRACFGAVDGLQTFTSGPWLYEAVSTHAGKENGLRAACAYLGIPLSRCAAIGDERNDVGMIAAAGLGVAVANALPEAKAAAKMIAHSCDEDGVAEVLERILSGGYGGL